MKFTFACTGPCSTKSKSWSSGGGGQATRLRPENNSNNFY